MSDIEPTLDITSDNNSIIVVWVVMGLGKK
jgi:hypothetical protein